RTDATSPAKGKQEFTAAVAHAPQGNGGSSESGARFSLDFGPMPEGGVEESAFPDSEPRNRLRSVLVGAPRPLCPPGTTAGAHAAPDPLLAGGARVVFAAPSAAGTRPARGACPAGARARRPAARR